MDLGEFDLIARIVERLPPAGPRVLVPSGDDAAVTELRGPAVISVDALVQDVHFTIPEFPLEAVGRKGLAAALSDLAAMGADPAESFVVLGIPPGLEASSLLALADGVAAVARREGVGVIGGDVTRAPALLLSVTAVGTEPAGSPLVRRAGAAPGQAVVVTGEIGGAAAALSLLEAGAEPPAGLAGNGRERLLARQLDPIPRLAAGRALAAAGAAAMIDISDGLAADAGHLAEAGSVRLELELERLPLQAGLDLFGGSGIQAQLLAAGGGEDYELLACLARERLEEARAAVERTGCALTEIGRVVEGEGVALRDSEGELHTAEGFDHLR